MYNLQIYFIDENFNHIIFTNIIKDLHLINKVVQYIKIFDVNYILNGNGNNVIPCYYMITRNSYMSLQHDNHP